MAITYALVCQVFFILMFTCVGLLRQGYTTQQILQTRMCVGFILNVIFCHIQNISVYPKNNVELKLMVLRGVLGGIALLILFQSFKLLNISDGIVIANTNPLWTSLLASVFLGEKITKKQVIFSLVSFTGIILIVKPNFLFKNIQTENQTQIPGRNQFLGCMLALIASFLLSAIQIISSKVQKQLKCNSAQLLIYNHFFSCIISGLVQLDSPNNSIQITKEFIFIILIMGLFGFIAQLLFFRSFTLEKASVVSPLQYTEVVLSFAVDIFFFNEQIFLLNVIGSILVIIGSIAILI
ncbi:hypothetical protein ABPG74_013381 [Tetrahymena malaccensis]